jgi:hypothetical protein
MERSNSCARIGGHSHAVDPAERDRRSNRPSVGRPGQRRADGPHGPSPDGFVGVHAGVFVKARPPPILGLSDQPCGHRINPNSEVASLDWKRRLTRLSRGCGTATLCRRGDRGPLTTFAVGARRRLAPGPNAVRPYVFGIVTGDSGAQMQCPAYPIARLQFPPAAPSALRKGSEAAKKSDLSC